MSLIAALLDVTPRPAGDIDTLLATFESMIVKRTEILTTIDPAYSIPDVDLAIFEELAARQDAWIVALGDARSRVRDQRVSTTKLRAYGK